MKLVMGAILLLLVGCSPVAQAAVTSTDEDDLRAKIAYLEGELYT
jgi:outer membrane murein-binding lipoprotein Lpp